MSTSEHCPFPDNVQFFYSDHPGVIDRRDKAGGRSVAATVTAIREKGYSRASSFCCFRLNTQALLEDAE